VLDVGKIASQVGYDDTSSFTRLFWERIGMSPGSNRGRFQPACIGFSKCGGVYVPSKELKTDPMALEEFDKRLQSELGIALSPNLDCELCKLFRLQPQALDNLLALIYDLT